MKYFISKFLQKKLRFAILSIALTMILFVSYSFVNNDFKLVRSLDIYFTLFRELNMYYVDETDPDKLVKSSIEGMLQNLDPYTVFIDEEQLAEYDFMTTGKYGGIGAIVRKVGNTIVIVEPYQNSPAYKAGLKAGDIIHEIDKKPIGEGKFDDISELLKGDPSTKIEMIVERLGVSKKMKFVLQREKIAINSVSYYGFIENNVGYIKLNGFTEGAHLEFKNALKTLKETGATSLVIDLRDNPGGLLSEAVTIVNFFVDKGVEIVNTKGKLSQFSSTYKTVSQPIDTNIPIVVLVNKNSASASEIVAGAFQDLDRAIIVGQRTYGKGLVQATRQLSYNTKLKITTAKYYIPSGRCIQALDYSHQNIDGTVTKVPDSLIREFKTKSGRKVYDGGGVMPDFYIPAVKVSKVCYELYSKNILFNYATYYAQKHESISKPENFVFSDTDYTDFLNFVKQQKFEYQSESENAIVKLQSVLKKENYSKDVESELTELSKKVVSSKLNDLELFKNQIIKLLSEEIVSRYFFQSGRVRYNISDDLEVKKAKEILNDNNQYNGVLLGTIKPKNSREVKIDDDNELDILF